MSADYTLPPLPLPGYAAFAPQVQAYGHSCAEHVMAPLLARIAELETRTRAQSLSLRAAESRITYLRSELAAKDGEVEKLRSALSQCATAVGASACADCSVEFLACVPREVELVVEKFRADAERLEWLSLKWGGLRGDYAAWVLRRGGTGDLSDIRSFVDAARKGEGSEG